MAAIIKMGPWGGQGGNPWEWNGPIKKIIVKYADVVDSITFGFVKNGSTVWSEKFGGDGGKPTEISFQGPEEEYLVGIKGTTGSSLITSLTFISNIRSYGPYGKDTANQFSLPMQGGKIVGFHGRRGQFLDAIGFNVTPLGDVMKAAGPWGTMKSGREWKWDGPVEKIIVRHGSVINSITFGYTKDGATVLSEKFGGDGGEYQEISLKEPEEYLRIIKGSTGKYLYPDPLITSMTFITNKRTYGPYGKESENKFYYSVEGKITRFYGRCGQFLDAIGFSLFVPKHIRPSNMTVVGPWGTMKSGREWKWDGPIERIIVTHGGVVDSITFAYVKDGAIMLSEKFGGDGANISEISLKEPEEYLVTIEGSTGLYLYPDPLIASLTFITNKRKYGPYGKESKDKFSYAIEGEILSFHGRCGQFLDAIGLNVVSSGLPKPISPI